MDELLPEHALETAVDLMVRVVEAAGAVIIFIGAVVAFVWFVIVAIKYRSTERFVPVRLSLGRFLALGLEFQLASDILRTAIAPTLQQIAELAAVAAIRTALNYFLAREIKEERAELDRRADSPADASSNVDEASAEGKQRSARGWLR